MADGRRKLDDEEWLIKALDMALTRLGFDMSEPIEIQNDISFLRKARKNVDIAKKMSWSAIVLGCLGWVAKIIGMGNGH